MNELAALPPPAAAARLRESLYAFLLSAFSTDELFLFLKNLPDGEQLVSSLPSPENTPATILMDKAVDKLIRVGRVDAEFFFALKRAVPRRSNDIARIAEVSHFLSAPHLIALATRDESSVISLGSWVLRRARNRRILGSFTGIGVSSLSLLIVRYFAGPMAIFDAALVFTLGAVIGYVFPVLGARLRFLRQLEDYCVGLVALEAAQAPAALRDALASHLIRILVQETNAHAVENPAVYSAKQDAPFGATPESGTTRGTR